MTKEILPSRPPSGLPASGYWSPTPHQSWPAYATAQRIRSAQSQTKWPIRPGNPTKISNPTTSPGYPWQQPGSRSAATQRDLGAGQLGERRAGPEPDVRGCHRLLHRPAVRRRSPPSSRHPSSRQRDLGAGRLAGWGSGAPAPAPDVSTTPRHRTAASSSQLATAGHRPQRED